MGLPKATALQGSSTTTAPDLPPVDDDGVIRLEPKEMLACHMVKSRNQVTIELLARCQGSNDATWETCEKLKEVCPHLVGKVF